MTTFVVIIILFIKLGISKFIKTSNTEQTNPVNFLDPFGSGNIN